MLITPVTYTLAVGGAEGPTPLNAFDHALLTAGIGNLNLLKVSSILPPGAKFVQELDIPPGSLTPTAYCTTHSTTPGERITAAVGVGLSRDSFGVIMEFADSGTKAEAERAIHRMLLEAFGRRGMELVETRVRAVEHRVEQVGAVVAAVLLWY